MDNGKWINIGDKVRLHGYGTKGRVVAEQHDMGVRMLMVAWPRGGYRTAPEGSWRLVSEIRMMRALLTGVAILGLTVCLVTLNLLT